MYHDDYDGISDATIEARYKQRQDRIDFMSYGPPYVAIPGKAILNSDSRNRHFANILGSIQPNDSEIEASDLADSLQLMRVAVSDIEETEERQRFLKYDRIWARAEAAFIELKSLSNT